MKQLTIEDLSNIKRPRLGNEVPIITFRLLRLIGIKEILGDSAAPTLYMTGKSIGNKLSLDTVEEFKQFIIDQKIGLPEIEEVDKYNLIVKMGECMTCNGLPNIEELICHFESGLIAGAMENIYQKRAKSVQTKGISHGDSYCQFEVFFY